MFLPVQIPTAVEHQGTQGSQSVTGLFTPMHTMALLSPSDDQIVTFFDVGTADILPLCPTVSVAGDVRLAVLEVVDQLVEFLEVLGLRAVCFQAVYGVLHLSAPKTLEQPAQQLGFGLAARADLAGQVVALLAAMIPIQGQSGHRPGSQACLEETIDPTRPITQQGHFGLRAAPTQHEQEEQLR
jgi:hypothetical protein